VRFAAYIVDWIIVSVTWVALIGVATLGSTVGALAGFAGLAISLFYAPVMLAYHGGATWGKQAMQQRVVISADGAPTGFGRAFLREFAKVILAAFLFPWVVSAVMIAARTDKRALHDLIAGTAVVRA
jgi:uncharacterized RDD family membrane protein YckC